ncbi:MAG: hypothetical protein K8I30_23295 [Anaerolineae bacterium]|nr:hypothetical protein [Anaerolineae bacterium]
MSDSTIQAIVPALIALLGTLLTIAVGVWQWRRQNQAQRADPFKADKQAAYKALWDKLEDAHVKIRVENTDTADYKKVVQDINGFMLKQALYLDEADRILANTYLKNLQAFSDFVQSSANESLKETWADTGAFPPEMTNAVRAYQQMEAARNQILERCRKVLNG